MTRRRNLTCEVCGASVSDDSKRYCAEHRHHDRIQVHRRISPPGTPQPTPCRVWRGACDKAGYPRYGRKRLHRWVMEQALGRTLTPDEKVMHLCDNPPCFRFDHLQLGTDAENIADREAKGRGRNFTNVKMTPEQVLEIRARRDRGEPAKSIAADFGLTTAGVYSIGNRQAWKSIPEATS